MSLANVSEENRPTVGFRYMVIDRYGEHKRAKLLDVRTVEHSSDKMEYFVTYEDTNKRMDRWVTLDLIDLSTEQSEEPPPSISVEHRVTRRMTTSLQDDPLEKAFMEKNAVRYINEIYLGNYRIDCWYHSPYPEPYCACRRLFICPYCLLYYSSAKHLKQHFVKCTLRSPPGTEVYRKGKISVFEVYGSSEYKLYCQNLSLLAKLFLDHKTLYYDVEPFIYYILCEVNSFGAMIAGYFSKERYSCDNHNLACILVLPPFQRRGYGHFMIALDIDFQSPSTLPQLIVGVHCLFSLM